MSAQDYLSWKGDCFAAVNILKLRKLEGSDWTIFGNAGETMSSISLSGQLIRQTPPVTTVHVEMQPAAAHVLLLPFKVVDATESLSSYRK